MTDKTTLFELKEKAKWSRDQEEKKNAIKELSIHGQEAIPQLEEILNITAYDDIRIACAEAIKVIRANSKDSERPDVSDSKAPGTASATDKKTQKKDEKEGESGSEAELSLADLPP